MNADYSVVMPFVVKALLDKHSRGEPYRLYDKRGELIARLMEDVRANEEWLTESLDYPLAAIHRRG
jgi:hypothetical protein